MHLFPSLYRPEPPLYINPIDHPQPFLKLFSRQEPVDKVQPIVASHHGAREAAVFWQLDAVVHVVGVNGPFFGIIAYKSSKEIVGVNAPLAVPATFPMMGGITHAKVGRGGGSDEEMFSDH